MLAIGLVLRIDNPARPLISTNPSRGWNHGEARKYFFFEKKKQKTFAR